VTTSKLSAGQPNSTKPYKVAGRIASNTAPIIEAHCPDRGHEEHRRANLNSYLGPLYNALIFIRLEPRFVVSSPPAVAPPLPPWPVPAVRTAPGAAPSIRGYAAPSVPRAVAPPACRGHRRSIAATECAMDRRIGAGPAGHAVVQSQRLDTFPILTGAPVWTIPVAAGPSDRPPRSDRSGCTAMARSPPRFRRGQRQNAVGALDHRYLSVRATAVPSSVRPSADGRARR
jgi:hypothetical protein